MRTRFHFPQFLLPLLVVAVLLGIPSLSPTVAAAPVNIDDELAITKQGYDNIQQYLFKKPDNIAMLAAGYNAAQKTLASVGPPLTFAGDANAQWRTFADGIRALAGQSTANVPTGMLRQRMLGAMTMSVGDGHTYYLTKDEYDRERALLVRGDTSIVNYGFSRVNVGSNVYLRSVVPGSNMDRAGAHTGDQLLTFDGQPITPTNAAGLLAMPKEGAMHVFTVRRMGEAMPLSLTVTLERYSVSSLVYRVLDGHIGYIQVSQFLAETPGKLDDALADLHGQGVDALIVDVRDDPGGLASAESRFIGRFVPDGTLLGQRVGRDATTDNLARSEGHAPDDLPLVVLANNNSASAAEYYMLAMQELRGATVVGVTTAGGLGTARSLPLRDGSALSITISAYTSAKGARLNGIGITPDIPVANLTPMDVVNGRDPQLDTAIGQVNMPAMRPAA